MYINCGNLFEIIGFNVCLIVSVLEKLKFGPNTLRIHKEKGTWKNHMGLSVSLFSFRFKKYARLFASCIQYSYLIHYKLDFG